MVDRLELQATRRAVSAGADLVDQVEARIAAGDTYAALALLDELRERMAALERDAARGRKVRAAASEGARRRAEKYRLDPDHRNAALAVDDLLATNAHLSVTEARRRVADRRGLARSSVARWHRRHGSAQVRAK